MEPHRSRAGIGRLCLFALQESLLFAVKQLSVEHGASTALLPIASYQALLPEAVHVCLWTFSGSLKMWVT